MLFFSMAFGMHDSWSVEANLQETMSNMDAFKGWGGVGKQIVYNDV